MTKRVNSSRPGTLPCVAEISGASTSAVSAVAGEAALPVLARLRVAVDLGPLPVVAQLRGLLQVAVLPDLLAALLVGAELPAGEASAAAIRRSRSAAMAGS